MKVSGEEETDLFLLGGPGAEAHDQVRVFLFVGLARGSVRERTPMGGAEAQGRSIPSSRRFSFLFSSFIGFTRALKSCRPGRWPCAESDRVVLGHA